MTFDEARTHTLLLYRGLGWASFFTRIRFFTAPYRALEPIVPKRGVIIDMGSGYGMYGNLLALLSSERRVLGFELDESKARFADRGVSNASFQCADITKVETEPADAILLIHVLHHLDSFAQQEELVRACSKRLAPGGALIVCEVDRKPWWKFWLGQFADWTLYPGDSIFYRFAPQMRQMLETQGFKVEATPMHHGTPFAHITYVCRNAGLS